MGRGSGPPDKGLKISSDSAEGDSSRFLCNSSLPGKGCEMSSGKTLLGQWFGAAFTHDRSRYHGVGVQNDWLAFCSLSCCISYHHFSVMTCFGSIPIPSLEVRVATNSSVMVGGPHI